MFPFFTDKKICPSRRRDAPNTALYTQYCTSKSRVDSPALPCLAPDHERSISRILSCSSSAPIPVINGIPLTSGTPYSFFALTVATIRTVPSRCSSTSEILIWQISASTPYCRHSSSTFFAAIVEVATAPPQATIIFFFMPKASCLGNFINREYNCQNTPAPGSPESPCPPTRWSGRRASRSNP